MKRLKKLFLRMRLRWLERQIGEEFDSGLSLKIDRLHALLNNQDNEYKTYQVIFWLARAWELVKKSRLPSRGWLLAGIEQRGSYGKRQNLDRKRITRQ